MTAEERGWEGLVRRRREELAAKPEGEESPEAAIAAETVQEAAKVAAAGKTIVAPPAAKVEAEEQGREMAILEVLDEVQITEELKGRALSEDFYTYEQGGREISGISYAGVKDVTRLMGAHGEPIDLGRPEFEEGEDENGRWVGCLVPAKNLRMGVTRWGYAAQARTMKLRTGQRMPDPFAKSKCLSKAARNALRAHIPETLIVALYDEWRRQNAAATAGQRPPT